MGEGKAVETPVPHGIGYPPAPGSPMTDVHGPLLVCDGGAADVRLPGENLPPPLSVGWRDPAATACWDAGAEAKVRRCANSGVAQALVCRHALAIVDLVAQTQLCRDAAVGMRRLGPAGRAPRLPLAPAPLATHRAGTVLLSILRRLLLDGTGVRLG